MATAQERLSPPPSAYERFTTLYQTLTPENGQPYAHTLADGTMLEFIPGKNAEHPTMAVLIAHPLAETRQQSLHFVVDQKGLEKVTFGGTSLTFTAIGKTQDAGKIVADRRIHRDSMEEPEKFAQQGDFFATVVEGMLRKNGYIEFSINQPTPLAPKIATIQAAIRNAEIAGRLHPDALKELYKIAGMGEPTDEQMTNAAKNLPKPEPKKERSMEIDLYAPPLQINKNYTVKTVNKP